MIQTTNIKIPLEGFTIMNGTTVMMSRSSSETELKVEYRVSDTNRFEVLRVLTTEPLNFKQRLTKGVSQFGVGRLMMIGKNIDVLEVLTLVSTKRVKDAISTQVVGALNG